MLHLRFAQKNIYTEPKLQDNSLMGRRFVCKYETGIVGVRQIRI